MRLYVAFNITIKDSNTFEISLQVISRCLDDAASCYRHCLAVRDAQEAFTHNFTVLNASKI